MQFELAVDGVGVHDVRESRGAVRVGGVDGENRSVHRRRLVLENVDGGGQIVNGQLLRLVRHYYGQDFRCGCFRGKAIIGHVYGDGVCGRRDKFIVESGQTYADSTCKNSTKYTVSPPAKNELTLKTPGKLEQELLTHAKFEPTLITPAKLN